MKLDLKALREAARKATPGPWKWVEDSPKTHLYGYNPVDEYDYVLSIYESHGGGSVPQDDDRRYMELANPTTILALLDQLERYQKALKYYAGFTMNAPFPECPYCKIEPYSNCHALGTKAREALGDVDAGLLTTEEWKKMNEGCT